MNDLTINEFLNRADDYLANTVVGNEGHRIKTSFGNAVLMSEEEYNKLKEYYNKKGNDAKNEK